MKRDARRASRRRVLAAGAAITAAALAPAIRGLRSAGAQAAPSGSVQNLEQDVALWDARLCQVRARNIDCAGAGAPAFSPPALVSDPSGSGTILALGLTGGPPGVVFGDVLYQANLDIRPANEAVAFLYELSFQYSPQAADVGALEFAINLWGNGAVQDWEAQWFREAGVWRIWSGAEGAWVAPLSGDSGAGIPGDVPPGEWQSLALKVDVVDGQSHYHSLTINGTEYLLDRTFAPRAAEGSTVTVHCQLDGNGKQDAFDTYLSNVNLTWYASSPWS